MTTRRRHLAQRRRALGYSQESLAERLGADRSTVARWERGQCEPQPFVRVKLATCLQVTMAELDILLAPLAHDPATDDQARSLRRVSATSDPRAATDLDGIDLGETDDMNRRELLRLLSITGTLVSFPYRDLPDVDGDTRPSDAPDLGQYEQLNAYLWQVFALSPSKRLVYPVVRQQLSVLTTGLERASTSAAHQRLCVLAGDLFQLAGEIFFDGNRYTDAAYCYTLATTASREGGAHDLVASALTRHAFISLYERRFEEARSVLSVAARAAERGDPQLSTRHWVAAVQAQALAGLGDMDACSRALDAADQVLTLDGPVTSSGWLRFDGDRLAEERGTCYLRLGRPDRATDQLTEALNQAISLRRRASVLTDLATLGIHQRDLDQALQYGSAATDLAEHTQSAGYVGRKLHALRTQLGPFTADNRVKQLTDRISELATIA